MNAYRLSKRENQVIACLLEGSSNKDIGLALGTSEQTVKNHFKSIFDKTGMSSRLELALFVLAKNLHQNPMLARYQTTELEHGTISGTT